MSLRSLEWSVLPATCSNLSTVFFVHILISSLPMRYFYKFFAVSNLLANIISIRIFNESVRLKFLLLVGIFSVRDNGPIMWVCVW